jgi:hypothetical protein
MQPLARKDKLTTRELPDETLVYDLERHTMHCLNRTAALVWKHCDGRHDHAALAALLARELGLAAPEADAAARLALDQLDRRKLLQEAVAPEPEAERLTRRKALRQMATAAAAAIPLVMSLRSPSVAWAQQATGGCKSASDCTLGPCQISAICSYQPLAPGPHFSFKTINPFPGTCSFFNAQDGTPCGPNMECSGGQCVQKQVACSGNCFGAGSQGNCPSGCKCVGPLQGSTGTCMPA